MFEEKLRYFVGHGGFAERDFDVSKPQHCPNLALVEDVHLRDSSPIETVGYPSHSISGREASSNESETVIQTGIYGYSPELSMANTW